MYIVLPYTMLYTTPTILVLLLSHTHSLPNHGYYLVKNSQDGGNKPLVGRAEIKDAADEEAEDNSWDMFGLFNGGTQPDEAKVIPEDKKSNNGVDPIVTEDVLKADSESKNEILK